jgi:hypothetical protein
MTERWDNGFWGIEGMGIASPAPHYKGGKFEGNAEKSFLGTSNLSSLQALFPVYPD